MRQEKINHDFSGRILNRFSKDIGTVDEYLPRCVIEVIQIIAVMIGIMLQVLIINYWIIIPIIIVSVLYNVTRTIYTPKAENLKRLEGNGIIYIIYIIFLIIRVFFNFDTFI